MKSRETSEAGEPTTARYGATEVRLDASEQSGCRPFPAAAEARWSGAQEVPATWPGGYGPAEREAQATPATDQSARETGSAEGRTRPAQARLRRESGVVAAPDDEDMSKTLAGFAPPIGFARQSGVRRAVTPEGEQSPSSTLPGVAPERAKTRARDDRRQPAGPLGAAPVRTLRGRERDPSAGAAPSEISFIGSGSAARRSVPTRAGVERAAAERSAIKERSTGQDMAARRDLGASSESSAGISHASRASVSAKRPANDDAPGLAQEDDDGLLQSVTARPHSPRAQTAVQYRVGGRGWLWGLGAVSAALVLAISWIPVGVDIHAQGFLRTGGAQPVVSPVKGTLSRYAVALGDSVAPGDALVEINAVGLGQELAVHSAQANALAEADQDMAATGERLHEAGLKALQNKQAAIWARGKLKSEQLERWQTVLAKRRGELASGQGQERDVGDAQRAVEAAQEGLLQVRADSAEVALQIADRKRQMQEARLNVRHERLQADAALDGLRAWAQQTTVKASEPGTVQAILLGIGAAIEPGTELIWISSESGPPRGVAYVPESEARYLRVGMPVQLSLLSDWGSEERESQQTTLKAEVSAIGAPVADHPESIEVELQLDAGAVRAGARWVAHFEDTQRRLVDALLSAFHW